MWETIMSFLAGNAEKGGSSTSALDKRRQYFQQLMGQMSPSMNTRSSVIQGNSGDLMSLVSLLSGQQRYNPYIQSNNNPYTQSSNGQQFDLSSWNNY